LGNTKLKLQLCCAISDKEASDTYAACPFTTLTTTIILQHD